MRDFKENQTFQLPFYGNEYAVSVVVNSYVNNGNLFVGLVSTDEEGDIEPFGDVTVNISDLPPYHAALDTNNMSGIESFVEREGLAQPSGECLRSGYCQYPVYEFDREALQKLHPSGFDDYQRGIAAGTEHQLTSLVEDFKAATGVEPVVFDLTME